MNNQCVNIVKTKKNFPNSEIHVYMHLWYGSPQSVYLLVCRHTSTQFDCSFVYHSLWVWAYPLCLHGVLCTKQLRGMCILVHAYVYIPKLYTIANSYIYPRTQNQVSRLKMMIMMMMMALCSMTYSAATSASLMGHMSRRVAYRQN